MKSYINRFARIAKEFRNAGFNVAESLEAAKIYLKSRPARRRPRKVVVVGFPTVKMSSPTPYEVEVEVIGDDVPFYIPGAIEAADARLENKLAEEMAAAKKASDDIYRCQLEIDEEEYYQERLIRRGRFFENHASKYNRNKYGY